MLDCIKALITNDLESLKKNHAGIYCNCRVSSIRLAIDKKNIDFIKYIVDQEFIFLASTVSLLCYTSYAAEFGNCEIVQYFDRIMSSVFSPIYLRTNREITRSIALNKNKDVIKHAIQLGYDLEDSIYFFAALKPEISIKIIEEGIFYNLEKFLSHLDTVNLIYNIDNVTVMKFVFEIDQYKVEKYHYIMKAISKKEKELKQYKKYIFNMNIPDDIANLIITFLF